MAKATGRKAHELTHFIKDWSSVKYRALADTLVKQYQKQGESVSNLVDNQIAKAKHNGREMSRPEAFDEVVADSMESIWDGYLREGGRNLPGHQVAGVSFHVPGNL